MCGQKCVLVQERQWGHENHLNRRDRGRVKSIGFKMNYIVLKIFFNSFDLGFNSASTP